MYRAPKGRKLVENEICKRSATVITQFCNKNIPLIPCATILSLWRNQCWCIVIYPKPLRWNKRTLLWWNNI